MTDTPIYDQIRQELRDKAEEPQAPQGGKRGQPESGTGVSVWALIDEHRPPEKPTGGGGRRRS
ncbi:hypothetical protein [Actinokineospora globicatena]|uniref:Uncharacterized protein n=1 Tax=Actinokineospora globicatena TaxID=103729 RepID=A0A9W6QKS1_9PSEU|nr:hypothetical protein [Actinokineospora globicatena]MCP2302702.1 hypothetical protein [Actinokineospora globicatena]GLW75610.1 hypothetical protein Aglo01_00920 [Actinokineospora globicatena]GLW91392.1 hypothetical protein Aglo03_22080 [Actinokineospora globicatena]